MVTGRAKRGELALVGVGFAMSEVGFPFQEHSWDELGKWGKPRGGGHPRPDLEEDNPRPGGVVGPRFVGRPERLRPPCPLDNAECPLHKNGTVSHAH